MEQNRTLFSTEKGEILTFLERFVPTFGRFFQSELNIKPSIYLSSIEEGLENLPRCTDMVFFGVNTNLPTAFFGISRSFIFGLIDFLLGSGQFDPDYDTESWSNLDESLAVPFIERLWDVFSGYCGHFVLEKITVSALSPDAIPYTFDVCSKIDWIIEIEKNSFLFTFFLPGFTSRDLQPKAYKDHMKPAEEDDILDYIESRRAFSKISYNTQKKPSREKESKGLLLRIRIGSFYLKSGNINMMKPGDILATDVPADSHFHLILGGESVGTVTPCEKNGIKAVVIE